MKKNNEESLIRQVSKTIDCIGVKKTLEVLKSAENSNDTTDKEVEVIIDTTCQVFGVSKQKILTKISTRPKNCETESLMCIIVLLEQSKFYTIKEIGKIVCRTQPLCFNYIRRFYQLNPKHPVDSDILDKYNLIQSKIAIKKTKK